MPHTLDQAIFVLAASELVPVAPGNAALEKAVGSGGVVIIHRVNVYRANAGAVMGLCKGSP